MSRRNSVWSGPLQISAFAAAVIANVIGVVGALDKAARSGIADGFRWGLAGFSITLVIAWIVKSHDIKRRDFELFVLAAIAFMAEVWILAAGVLFAIAFLSAIVDSIFDW